MSRTRKHIDGLSLEKRALLAQLLRKKATFHRVSW
jgi:hypothetical protein